MGDGYEGVRQPATPAEQATADQLQAYVDHLVRAVTASLEDLAVPQTRIIGVVLIGAAPAPGRPQDSPAVISTVGSSYLKGALDLIIENLGDELAELKDMEGKDVDGA